MYSVCCSPQVVAKFSHYLGNTCVASCIPEWFVKKETAFFSCSIFSNTQPSDLFIGPWPWMCLSSRTICESASYIYFLNGQNKETLESTKSPMIRWFVLSSLLPACTIMPSRNDCLKSCSTISLLCASISHQKDAAWNTSQPSLWVFQYSELQCHLRVMKSACTFLINPLFPKLLRSLDVLLHDLLRLELFYTDSQSLSYRCHIGNA